MAKKPRRSAARCICASRCRPLIPSQLLALVNASKPFYEMLGGTEIRLLQNVDDPGKFIQMIEYETPEEMEINRAAHRRRSAHAGLSEAWRTMLPGGVEIDVFKDVEP